MAKRKLKFHMIHWWSNVFVRKIITDVKASRMT